MGSAPAPNKGKEK
jgi:hypothetical protein